MPRPPQALKLYGFHVYRVVDGRCSTCGLTDPKSLNEAHVPEGDQRLAAPVEQQEEQHRSWYERDEGVT